MLGIYAPGLRSLLTSQIRTFTSLLQSANYDRIENRELSSQEKDPWWTLVSFYSSLFDLVLLEVFYRLIWIWN